ncbi:MAG TPA: hypothetical protein VNM92_00010 [Thermoanaerobaculia bacterium]|nr:hypothetical protein [Thermoanaerobaculia bacterium]
MQQRRGERGEGKVGCLFGVIMLVGSVMVAYKMIPIKVKAAELRQVIVDEARSAGTHKDQVIRKTIMRKATELELPLNDKNLVIKRTGDNIKIEANYTVPIEFPGYTYNWNLKNTAENPIF